MVILSAKCHANQCETFRRATVDRRRLILAAEIYTETQPAFWRLTGQYARLSGKEVEEMDSPCQLAH
ncbi:hypothetical protein YX13_000505 [Salmonella enterica subsp. enterica serovar Urbana]|nr:hypothetical protein [Salmonella enterica subsp. enterica serovar Urbana]